MARLIWATAVESGLMNPQLESVSRQVRAWALRFT